MEKERQTLSQNEPGPFKSASRSSAPPRSKLSEKLLSPLNSVDEPTSDWNTGFPDSGEAARVAGTVADACLLFMSARRKQASIHNHSSVSNPCQ